MTIKTRVHLFQLVVGVAVVGMAIVVYLTIYYSEQHSLQVQWATRQLEAVTSLRVSANRFSEQIAELLLVGEQERADFESARVQMEAAFAKLERSTRGEQEFRSRFGSGKNLDELYRLERMRTLYREINKFVVQVVALRDAGRRDESISLFRRQIENRLDADFENLLTVTELDEKEEVIWAERNAETLRQSLTAITVVAAIVAVGISLVAGLLLMRSLTRPVRLLTQGTEAISQGDFHHRIEYNSSDELGELARRFNEMAATQERQRAQLLDARSSLERQVEERTRELASANQRLTELDRLRVQFLADISHELRTPLTALRGEAEVILRHGHKDEATYRDTLQRIMSQAVEMSRLIEDLLFLARTESGTIRVEPRPVVLQDLVKEALRDGAALARNKHISMSAEETAEPIWIDADPPRIKQVLMILLDNAVRYAPANSSVLVRASAVNGLAELKVRDNGAGIPAGEISSVFERFYRGRTSNTAARSGSGLGLAIAKWLVERHRGDIAIASEQGRFTEVTIRLPRLEVTSGEQDPAG